MYNGKIAKKISDKDYKSYRRQALNSIRELSGFIKVKPDRINDKLRKENGHTYLGKTC